MASANKSILKTLKWEGLVHTDIKDDKGGETLAGISRVYNPQWSGWSKVDEMKKIGKVNVQDLQPEIIDFYSKEYSPLEQISSQKIADQIYQAYTNCGKIAKKWAQQVCNGEGRSNLVIDGVLGFQSLSALNEISEKEFIVPYYEKQVAYYDAIVKRDETQRKFLEGWRKRAADFL